MKNYLLLIIDALNYSRVKKAKSDLMPFFNSIKKESIVCENMYSQAPYTEAAVMNIYCGQNVLDNGGYIRRFKDADNVIFEIMKEHGYKTYYNSIQPHCHASSLERGIDDYYYNVAFDIHVLWNYRLYHYADLFKNNGLTQKDWNLLIDLMNDNFNAWIKFTEEIKTHADSVSLIEDNNIGFNPEEVLTTVKEEFCSYRKDSKSYISNILDIGLEHKLFKLPIFTQNNKIKDENTSKEIYKLFNPICKQIRKENFSKNLKNNKRIKSNIISKSKIFLKHPSKENLKNLAKTGLALDAIIDTDLKKRIKPSSDGFKASPSARKHIDHYLNWLDNENEKTFACIHVDDIHTPEQFYTYDSDDMELLKKEADYAKEFLDSIPDDYKGSMTHDLSLRYIDTIIKYLFDRLDQQGKLKDTCIMITADHGFAYSYDPIRENYVINFYLEGYGIPFLIYNSGKPAESIYKLCASKDIPATLVDLACNTEVKSFSGYSVLNEKSHDTLFIEYCGGGCPDLFRRELKIAAYDENWFVGTLCSLTEDFDISKITEVYNLKQDPLQYENLKSDDHIEEITYLVEKLKSRYKELKEQLVEITYEN